MKVILLGEGERVVAMSVSDLLTELYAGDLVGEATGRSRLR
jgi:hypothetical protein